MSRKHLLSDQAMFFYFNILIFLLQFLFNYSCFLNHQKFNIPWIVLKQLGFAVALQILLIAFKSHVEFILFKNFKKLQLDFDKNFVLFAIFFSSTFFLYTINSIYFPLSLSSIIIKIIFINKLGLYIGMIFFGAIIIFLTLNTIYQNRNNHYKIMIFLSLFALIDNQNVIKNKHQELSEKTNIFIIGIDSLPASKVTKNRMPFLHSWLQNNVNFSHAITPVGKTSASWFSILTGLNPNHHGAFDNLIPKLSTKNHASIAWHFKNKGYQTIFASDERRFNNMDKEMGFDKIIGPKIGIADFILPKYFDFPLSNLLMHSISFSPLFPFQALNRADYAIFSPRKFDKVLKQVIHDIEKDKPIFWASHFTLPHWPYIAFDSNIQSSKDLNDILSFGDYFSKIQYQNYLKILKRADTELHHLYDALNNEGLLKNSIVIILSDHGETLYQAHSRNISPKFYQGHNLLQFRQWLFSKTGTVLTRSRGHGSDIMSLDQYSCVLGAMITVNNKKLSLKKKYQEWVNLIDIAPTILDIVDPSHNKSHFDGISLKSSILGDSEPLKRRFKIATGFIVDQNLTAEKINQLAEELFQVNNISGLLELKQNILHKQLYSSGIFYYPWLKVMFIENRAIKKTIIINLFTKQWTDNLNSTLAKEALPYV